MCEKHTNRCREHESGGGGGESYSTEQRESCADVQSKSPEREVARIQTDEERTRTVAAGKGIPWVGQEESSADARKHAQEHTNKD